MRGLVSALLLAQALWCGPPPIGFRVLADDPGGWPAILAGIGLRPGAPGPVRVMVLRANAPASPDWLARVDRGVILVVEGESPLAEYLGFRRTAENIRATSVRDERRPDLRIVWERGLELPRFTVPEHARVFAWERWTGAPVLAGFRRGQGAVLWAAVSPGERGYERFPYIPQALVDLGLEPPFRGRRLWAFLDSSYRLRVDLDYFARRWREAGIGGMHVAAWHFFEPDAQRDAWLARLIDACHRNGILVYAWLELPHVSERFWDDHPSWREKTAVLQDAHLDWRKLMNLMNPDCERAVRAGVDRLVSRFDWDGVNLAELYFESLQGAAVPSRFTPMNDEFRAAFRAEAGFDPLDVFGGRKDAASLRRVLDFRAESARRLQERWLFALDSQRRSKPHLDLVLTHIDDRFDTGMRDALGADTAALLPLLDKASFTFLIEDPATVWNLGPARYAEIAKRYAPLTRHTSRLAIDINIVERYQDVYPTKQQTGTELLQLVHVASQAFRRVALYFENSLLPVDLPLLPAAAASVTRAETAAGGWVIESDSGVGVNWDGPVAVNGRSWPVRDAGVVWLPAGAFTLTAGAPDSAVRMTDFTGDLKGASVNGGAIEIAYESASRAFAYFSAPVRLTTLDGASVSGAHSRRVELPRGQHVASFTIE